MFTLSPIYKRPTVQTAKWTDRLPNTHSLTPVHTDCAQIDDQALLPSDHTESRRSIVVCCHRAKAESKEDRLPLSDTIHEPLSELDGRSKSETSAKFIAFNCIIE